MRIENLLSGKAKEALSELFSAEVDNKSIQIQKTKKEFDGDLTLVVFPLLRASKKGPEQTAELIGQWMVDHVDQVTGFNVVKGFLNMEIADNYWLHVLSDALENNSFGFGKPNSLPQVMVEYSSPNTNKPLHLGHLRNNFLGYSVAQILKAAGHDVVKVQIINDRGIHICKSMVAWKRYADGETPSDTGEKGDKLVGRYYVKFDQVFKEEVAALIAKGESEDDAKKQAPIMLEAQEMLRLWEARDAETMKLWEMMNSWVYKGFETTYKTMGVDFDKLYYESNTYLKGKEEIEKGLEKGVFFKKEDGSVWCDLTPDGLDEKLVLRGDGTAVYMTQDIGTAILRFEDFPNLKSQVYTVGNEQEYHFKVLFLILDKLGFSHPGANYHLSYGMVELPEGKMKSREGTVVDADDLLDEMEATAAELANEQGKLAELSEEEKAEAFKMIGHGALKYFLLKVDPRKGMKFDPKESIDFLGNTGPFIQFNYVRTRALLRKAGGIGEAKSPTELHPNEKLLIKKLYDFEAVIKDAAQGYDPAGLANYTFELAKEFSSFYQQCPILSAEEESSKNFRLQLASKTGDVLKQAMGLLGIHMPERM